MEEQNQPARPPTVWSSVVFSSVHDARGLEAVTPPRAGWAWVFALVAGMSCAMGNAYGHPWMQEGAARCCGANDCKPYPREAIERTADGWVIKSTGQLFRDGDKGIFPLVDIDGHAKADEVWICVPPDMAPKAKCIFILPEGT